MLSFTRLEANRNLLTAMSLLPKSIHRCRRYPTKFNSGRGPVYRYKAIIGPRCGHERWRGNELNTELGARYSTR